LNSQCHRLERENNRLTKQVHELSDELESSKAYIDHLLKRKDKADEWKAKEKEYKDIIGNLKAQMRSGEATVPLALYRKAVDEARARAIECQDKRFEVNAMSRKMQALEQRLKDDKPKIGPPGLTPPEARPMRLNLRRVTPTSSGKPDETSTSTPKTPKVEHASNDIRPPPLPPTPRLSALREAGGRAGLCAKLKQMRRSPLVTIN